MLVILVLLTDFGVIIINNEIGRVPFTNRARRWMMHTWSDKSELGNTEVRGQHPWVRGSKELQPHDGV